MLKILPLLLCALVAHAAEPSLQVESPWVFAVPPGTKDTAAFMTLVNTGKVPVRVTGGSTDAAARLVPMVTTQADGRLGMKDVPSIAIPAGGRATLAPGGDHLMLYDLKQPLKPGGNVRIVLTLESGGTLTLNALVAKRPPRSE
jgi:copper(I)-binding protein